ncbi:MAG: tetratricopeptide repeat protein, partial [Waterburya sp.]
MQNYELYKDFITRLLYLESVDEIQRVVRDTPGLETDKLYQAINSLAAKLLEEKRTAEHNLLTFVKTAIDSVFKESDENTPLGNEITITEELIQLALTAPTAIRVYTILRRHCHLLSVQLYKDIERRISFEPHTQMNPTSPEVTRWMNLLCVLSLLLDDKAIAVRGYLFWAAHCRRAERYGNALRRLNRAARLSEDLNDASLKVWVIANRASLYDRMGEKVKAAEYYSKAQEIAVSSDQESNVITIHGAIIGCYRSLGRYSEALELINAHLPITQKLQLSLEEMNCHLLKGLVLNDLGSYEEAVAEYEEAAALADSLGERIRQGEAMTNIAASFFNRGNYREAVRRYRSILRTVEGWGNPIMIASAHNNLGNALLQMGRPYEAISEFSKALGVKMEAGDRYGEAVSFCGMGDSLLELGKRDRAETFYQMILIPALESHEAAKSRSFIASLADTAISPPASIPQALQEREAHLLKLERSLQDHEAKEEVQSETYRLERLREIRNDLQACWENMKPFAPEYVQLRLGEIMTLQACKSLLSSQADSSIAFVSFFCDRDSTTCFVIRSDEEKLHVFRSNINRQELLEVAQSLRRAFNGAPDEFPPYPPIRRDKPWKRNLSFFENLSGELLKFL